MDEISCFIGEGESSTAMRSVTVFVLLLEEFLKQNRDFIFQREIIELNRCLSRMTVYLEEGDLDSLVEIIESSLRGLLDDWDFNNKTAN